MRFLGHRDKSDFPFILLTSFKFRESAIVINFTSGTIEHIMNAKYNNNGRLQLRRK